MTNQPKQKGTAHESHTAAWFREHGWPFARRLTQKGSADEGDILLGDGIPVTVEAKAEKRITLAEYIKELDAEIVHAGGETGVVIIKRRGTTDVGKYYALTTVERWNDLARRVYPVQIRKRRFVRVE